MAIEGEGQSSEEPIVMPGKVFETTEDLSNELERSDSKEIRIWGKRLVEKGSSKITQKEYYNIENVPNDPNAHFDAQIYGIANDSGSTYFNLNSDENFHFSIKPENIKNWRIEVLLPKSE